MPGNNSANFAQLVKNYILQWMPGNNSINFSQLVKNKILQWMPGNIKMHNLVNYSGNPKCNPFKAGHFLFNCLFCPAIRLFNLIESQT